MRVIPLKGLIACGILCLCIGAATAWAAEVNVALGKPTSASSQWETASSPATAVDGVFPAAHPNEFHSGAGDYYPWWRVELGQDYLLKRVVLWNRQDCCQARLRDIKVEVLGPADAVLFETIVNPGGVLGGPASIEIVLDAGVPGLAVRVSRIPEWTLSGDERFLLQLSEVQVFADIPPAVSGAFSPDPANNAVRVGTAASDLAKTNVAFAWNSAVTGLDSDPNILVVDSKLVSHKFYLSKGTVNDPNVYFLAAVPAGSPVQATAQYGPVELTRNTTYYWRVDEVRLVNSVEQTIQGAVWKFQTVSDVPIITAVTPSSALAWSVESGALGGVPAESVSFTAQVENPYSKDDTGMTYAWYRVNAGGDIKVGEGSATFTIPTVHDVDAGQYYCVATLVVPATGKTAKSGNVGLGIKHIVGHWPLDGDFKDVVKGYDGTAVGNPVSFVPGIVATTGGGKGQAVKFDGLDGGAAQAVHMSSDGVPAHSSFTITLWEYTTSASRTGYFFASSDGVIDPGAGRPVGYEYIYIWRRAADDHYVGFNCGFNFSINGAYGDIYGNPRQQWNLCTFVYDYTLNQYHYYVNGIDRTGAVGISGRMEDFVADFYLGNRQNLGRAYEGWIDDMRIYDYVMSPQEIAELYLTSVGGFFCWTPVANDLNGDCIINLADLALMASNWTNCNMIPASACK